MKKYLLLLTCLLTLIACNNQKNKANVTESKEVVSNEQISPVVTDTITEAKAGETLNDIRFAGWGKQNGLIMNISVQYENISMHTTMERLQTQPLTSTKITYRGNS